MHRYEDDRDRDDSPRRRPHRRVTRTFAGAMDVQNVSDQRPEREHERQATQ